jgi:O-antigen/teichoic acid export membrane protein
MFIISYRVCLKKIPLLLKKEKSEKNYKILSKRELFNYSFPLMFSSVFSILYYWIDSFSLGYLTDVAQVGFYNAVVPIAMLISIIPDLFIQLFYPLITQEYSKKNFKFIEEISKQVSKWIFIITLPLFLLIFIFPGVIINILFGSEYLLAEKALRILSFGAFFSILAGLLTTLLAMAGKSKTLFMNLLITSILNLILNFIFINKFGINGAAFATCLVWIILTMTLFIEVKLTLSFIPLRKKMLKIILVSIFPLAILLLLNSIIQINLLSSLLLGILFLLIYLVVIFSTGCFDRKDMLILGDFKDKINSWRISVNKNIFPSFLNKS